MFEKLEENRRQWETTMEKDHRRWANRQGLLIIGLTILCAGAGIAQDIIAVWSVVS